MMNLKLSADEVISHFYSFLKKRRVYQAWLRGTKANRLSMGVNEFLTKNALKPRLLIGGAFTWHSVPLRAIKNNKDRYIVNFNNHRFWKGIQEDWMKHIKELNDSKELTNEN